MELKITDTNFKQEVLESTLPCLVDVWAQWCAPCNMIAPAVEQIAKEYQGKLKVCKLNIDDGRETTVSYGIRGIPTLLIFKNGAVVDTIIGLVPKEEIERKIQSHLA